MKLNLGAGLQQISGWMTVDFDERLGPDVVATIDALPFEDNSVEEIYASHCLEHVPYDSPALSEWLRVLEPGGLCTVVVPDVIQTYYLWRHGGHWGPYCLPVDELYVNATVFGAHLMAHRHPEMHFDCPGQVHHQIFIFDMLAQQMIRAGFFEVHEVVECSIRRSAIGETMVQGRKQKPLPSKCFTDEPYCMTRRPLPEGE